MNNTSSLVRRAFAVVLLAPMLIVAMTTTVHGASDESVIIRCENGCSSVIGEVIKMGGSVTHEYKSIDAIAAVVPTHLRATLVSTDGVSIAYKDTMIASPRPMDNISVDVAPGVQPIVGDALREILDDAPADFEFNNELIGADTMHGRGFTGGNVIVAVIDSGTANNAEIVPSIAGDVIGGENFVPDEGEPSATSTLNDSHGTWAASQISADIGFLFEMDSLVMQSIFTHAPKTAIPDFPEPGLALLPMIGVAPDADIYAMKVFPAAGGGSPESRVIEAMDRAITLRRNYNEGMPSVPVSGDGTEDNPYVYDSLNIQVVNMSLGGHTLFAGQDLEDTITKEMLEVGITLVASAGNEGHAAMTGGSPGTGIGSLTSGAMSTAAHERILRDLQSGLGFGDLYRPSNHTQMATFSSRGPTADGRISTNAVATGFANFAQGAAGELNFVSGTSFSAPQMAGAAALLHQAVPDASAVEVRNALQDYADPNLLGDNSAPIDQGRGVIDIPASRSALAAGHGRSDLEYGLANKSVMKNIKALGFEMINVNKGVYTTHLDDLVPGEVKHFFLRSHKHTKSFTISFTNIRPRKSADRQNQLFGDDIFVLVQDALTSSDATVNGGFFNADTTLTIDNPQTGVVRVAVMGDWTNAGRISADMTITEERSTSYEKTTDGRARQSETEFVFIDIPEGTSEAAFKLWWRNHWGMYPTDDLDLILIDPAGATIFDGATLDAPERVVITDPAPGTWVALIDGFTVHGVIDGKNFSYWELTASADGELITLEEE